MSGGRNKGASSAVVSLTCPHCGAMLKVDSQRENVSCEYCEASLIVPQITAEAPPSDREPPRELERDVEPELSERPFAKQPVRAPLKLEVQIAIATVIISGLILMFFLVQKAPASRESESWSSRSNSSDERSTPSKTSRDTELDGMIANADCQSKCTEPCMKISDPTQMIECMKACDDRCRFVGKGTGSECRGRCTKSCENAPNESSRSLCFSGCTKDCPP